MNWRKIFLISAVIVIVLIGGTIFSKANQKIINQKASVSKFNKVDVDITTGNVVLKIGSKYRIAYSGAEKTAPEIKVENNTLKIRSKQRALHINFFNLKQLNSQIVIEMPKKELENLNINSSNGNFSAYYLDTKTGEVNLSNGNINLKELKTQKGINLDTSKGNIRIENSNASGYDLNTSLGKITVAGKKHSKSFELESNAQNVLEADTSLGNISVK